MSGESKRTSTLTSVQAPPAPENCICTATIATSGSPQGEFHLKRKRAQGSQNFSRHRRISIRTPACSIRLDSTRPVQAQKFRPALTYQHGLHGRDESAELPFPRFSCFLINFIDDFISDAINCNRNFFVLQGVDGIG